MELSDFLAGIATVAGGASAIIAWASRSDTLKANERAEAAEAAALQAAQEAAAAHRASADALGGINTFISSEPERSRRRAACFGVLTAFFDLVSLPGQGRDMWHSEEHWKYIDAEKRALFDLGSQSNDAHGLGLTRQAFEILQNRQVRGVWDESECSTIKGIVGRLWEVLSTGPQSDDWWAERRAEIVVAT